MKAWLAKQPGPRPGEKTIKSAFDTVAGSLRIRWGAGSPLSK